ILEAEGDLGCVSTGKKNPQNFVLWKKAKQNEPSWDSPWGEGRPGWHIECSAMACATLPFPLDIHSGGVDLRFPHHENEMAQSEAAFHRPQWVNYFLHSGHLHIEGAKMSKSLKNFITIKECLEHFNSRHIRLLCLMNTWNTPMNYHPNGESMTEAVELDRFFCNFFALVQSVSKNSSLKESQKLTAIEFELNKALRQTKEKVHGFLCDNLNTASALLTIKSLVHETNAYLNSREANILHFTLILEISDFILDMLKIFGIVTTHSSFLQYTTEGAEQPHANSEILDILHCVGSFRKSVRDIARSGLKQKLAQTKDVQTISKDLLTVCDHLRDSSLMDLNVRLEDRPDGTFIVQKITLEEALREKQLKAEELEEKTRNKDERIKQLADQKAKKEKEASVPPHEYYKSFMLDKFSEFDSNGVPLSDSAGKPLSKAVKKSLIKFLEKHRKIHDIWLQSAAATSGV
ncbi:cysteine-tRna synthetase (CysRS), partial [Cardiosporidium cionae]